MAIPELSVFLDFNEERRFQLRIEMSLAYPAIMNVSTSRLRNFLESTTSPTKLVSDYRPGASRE